MHTESLNVDERIEEVLIQCFSGSDYLLKAAGKDRGRHEQGETESESSIRADEQGVT